MGVGVYMYPNVFISISFGVMDPGSRIQVVIRCSRWVAYRSIHVSIGESVADCHVHDGDGGGDGEGGRRLSSLSLSLM